jgi:predicted ester cyclase
MISNTDIEFNQLIDHSTLMQGDRTEATMSRTLIEGLYASVFSCTSAPDLLERMNARLAPDWESVGDYTGARKTRAQFGAQLSGFGGLIPDLAWKIEELIDAGDRFVVRGRASGTPVGTFFGVEPRGKKFEIMSIDIHTVANGLITRTYHVEDWAGALRQLTA